MFSRLFRSSSRSKLLEAAFNDVTTMLDQAGAMLDHSVEVLLENAPLELDLVEMDDVVDEGEREVRRLVLEHLSMNPKQDLVASLILVSIVNDAERIGDFARGLAGLASVSQSPRTGRFATELRELAGRVRQMFALTAAAFRDDDVENARRVIVHHTVIKREFRALVDRVAASELSADMAITYASGARILRRISAHLSNIASTVVQPFDRIRHGDEDV